MESRFLHLAMRDAIRYHIVFAWNMLSMKYYITLHSRDESANKTHGNLMQRCLLVDDANQICVVCKNYHSLIGQTLAYNLKHKAIGSSSLMVMHLVNHASGKCSTNQ